MSRVIHAGLVLAVALACISGVPVFAGDGEQPETRAEETRIKILLVQLAEQARSSDNIAFSVRAQAQAATLLWPYDAERARMIFRRAFEAVTALDSDKSDLARRSVDVGSSPSSRFQLRAELFNQVAARDPELVEEFARKLAPQTEMPRDALTSEPRGIDGRFTLDANVTNAPIKVDSEQRELLISVALQIVERDPNRAMLLGQLSLTQGPDNRTSFISPNFARLLMLMRVTDRTLARSLLSSALARLESSATPTLADIHALGSYLVSLQGSYSRDDAAKGEIDRFTKLAFDRIMRYRDQVLDGFAPSMDKSPRLDDKSTIYFIGRQLNDLLTRFMPDRLPQLKVRISELTETTSSDRLIDPGPIDVLGPADIVRQARAASDASERDSLYARAALSWLALGESGEAYNAATKVVLSQTRDRVLSQIARHYASEGGVEDAVIIARRIEDLETRAGVLVRSAHAAVKTRNRTRAAELLNEAEVEALKGEPSVGRTQGLLSIVSAFSTFDTVRAFEVMQSAVRSLNQIIPPADGRQVEAGSAALGEVHNEILHADGVPKLALEDTLAALARADFDGALLLAQQVTGKDVSVIAQLAVCRGGLIGNQTSDEEDGRARP